MARAAQEGPGNPDEARRREVGVDFIAKPIPPEALPSQVREGPSRRGVARSRDRPTG